MINKKDLVNKYVEYIDKDGKTRIEKVKRVTGNTITVINATKKKHRIHLSKINCQIHHRNCRTEIDKTSIRKKR